MKLLFRNFVRVYQLDNLNSKHWRTYETYRDVIFFVFTRLYAQLTIQHTNDYTVALEINSVVESYLYIYIHGLMVDYHKYSNICINN